MNKNFANIGKGDFIYRVIQDSYSDLRLYVYRITRKEDKNTDLGFGRSREEVDLEYFPWRYMDLEGPRYNTFRNRGRTEKKLFPAAQGCFQDAPGSSWYSDLSEVLGRFKYHTEAIENDISRTKRLLKFYQGFQSGRIDKDRWETMDYIGSWNGKPGCCPELLTWARFKEYWKAGRFRYQPEDMLDWNSCSWTDFRKFDHDPYTGVQIQWGKISADLKRITKKNNRI